MSASLSWSGLVSMGTSKARVAVGGGGKCMNMGKRMVAPRRSRVVVKAHLSHDDVDVVGFADRLGRLMYTIADVAVSTTAQSQSQSQSQNGGPLGGLTSAMETVLKVLKDALEALHIPYSYGFAIILLTILVKGATFPLTKKQVESTMAVQNLQPRVKEIQQKFAGNQEKIQLEIGRLYQKVGVNPLAGCLPTLATIPVWIGLYRALSNVANEGLLTEGFFWIPSLAGPSTIGPGGSGISWLFPFVDGQPPLGWKDTLAYLVLPMLLVFSQYISTQIMQPPQASDPSQKSSQAVLKFLPLMIGYFSLSVPSGLSLYWLTNNILSTAQQVWLRKLGGAKLPLPQEAIEIESVEEVNIIPSEPVIDLKQPRPGERFKRIKAEEDRKRKERETAAEAARQASASNSVSVENKVTFDHVNNLQNKDMPHNPDLSEDNAKEDHSVGDASADIPNRKIDDFIGKDVGQYNTNPNNNTAAKTDNFSESTSEHSR